MSKPKGGRPPIAAEDRRSKMLVVRVTQGELDSLKVTAALNGVNVAKWVRTRLDLTVKP